MGVAEYFSDARLHCGVEQLVARRTNPKVAGSSPAPANSLVCLVCLF